MKEEKIKKIWISLLNWNGIEETLECINSLDIFNSEQFDIYILDNGSQNNEYDILQDKISQYKNFFLLRSEENLWFTWWNNFLIQKIQEKKYKYIMLLSSDCIFTKDFLDVFISKVESLNQPWIFWPVIKNLDNSVQSAGVKMNLYTWSSYRYKDLKWNHIYNYSAWAIFLISYEIISQIGTLDDIFFAYYEESDYCLRAEKAWYKTYIIPNVYVYHKEETASKKDKPYYCYLMFRNRILFLKKHANIFQYYISYIFLWLYLLVLFPNNFWFKNYKYAFLWCYHWIIWRWWKLPF